jgi:hypothetical protein
MKNFEFVISIGDDEDVKFVRITANDENDNPVEMTHEEIATVNELAYDILADALNDDYVDSTEDEVKFMSIVFTR